MKTVKEMAKDAKVYIKEHKLEVGVAVGAIGLMVITKGKSGKEVLEKEVYGTIPEPDWTVDILTGNTGTWYINKLTETPMNEIIDELVAGEYTIE